jgi:hypothetical protein
VLAWGIGSLPSHRAMRHETGQCEGGPWRDRDLVIRPRRRCRSLAIAGLIRSSVRFGLRVERSQAEQSAASERATLTVLARCVGGRRDGGTGACGLRLAHAILLTTAA